MPTVYGDVTIRVGSEDPIIWNLLKDNGEDPVILTGFTLVDLRMKQLEAPFASKNFDTDGTKLSVPDEANGQVMLSQAADDFPAESTWKFCFKYILADAKVRFVSEKINYKLTVKEIY